MSNDLASQLARHLQAKDAELRALRSLLCDIHIALIAAGWRDDEIMQRVKAARQVGPVDQGVSPSLPQGITVAHKSWAGEIRTMH